MIKNLGGSIPPRFLCLYLSGNFIRINKASAGYGALKVSFSPSVFKFNDFGRGENRSRLSEESVLKAFGLLNLKLNNLLVNKTHSVVSHSDTLALANSLKKGEIVGKKERAVASKSEATVASVGAVVLIAFCFNSKRKPGLNSAKNIRF